MIVAGNNRMVTIDGSPGLAKAYYWNEPPVNLCLLPAIIPEALVLPDSKFVFILCNNGVGILLVLLPETPSSI